MSENTHPVTPAAPSAPVDVPVDVDVPIRVLMLFTILNRGGAETMVMNYYRHIDRMKVQFDFVVHREERGAYEDEIEQLGGRIYRFMPLRPWTIPHYKKQIKRFFDEHPEYRIIHGQCSESGYFFYKEASRRKIPHIIAHAHSSHVPFDLKLVFRTWLKHKMRPYLTDYFACGIEAAEWLFGKKLARKAMTLPNAIDTKLYQFSETIRQKKREQLGINPQTMVICHVGSFVKAKNHQFMLSVFIHLLEHNPDALLLLIGDGELKCAIESKVQALFLSENVRFLGTRTDVNELLMASDVFLFPSIHEGLPLSLLEAQCSGLPCLISDGVPQEACMTDLTTCLSLHKNKVEDWVNAIIKQSAIHCGRSVYTKQITAAGYDVEQNALWLQNYYLL